MGENENKKEEGFFEIDINRVFPNDNQARKYFNENAILELSESIKKHGVIEPIVVVKKNDGYMIIAGERRFRASKLAGLNKVPVIIKKYEDKEIQTVSLIENLQRETLSPIEMANGIKKLIEDYSLTQQEVADMLSKSRPAVANTLRLLTLHQGVQDLISQGKLSGGHGRALASLPQNKQLNFALKTIKKKMSVRVLEEKIREFLNPTPQNKREEKSLELKNLSARMQRVFGTRVTVLGNDKNGKIQLDYYSQEDLNRLYEILDKLEGKRLF